MKSFLDILGIDAIQKQFTVLRHDLTSVSYTHLDVYKRQEMGRAFYCLAAESRQEAKSYQDKRDYQEKAIHLLSAFLPHSYPVQSGYGSSHRF